MESRTLEPTLNQTLASLGFTKRPARSGSIGTFRIQHNGETLFTGDAGEVWAWLHAESLI